MSRAIIWCINVTVYFLHGDGVGVCMQLQLIHSAVNPVLQHIAYEYSSVQDIPVYLTAAYSVV